MKKQCTIPGWSLKNTLLYFSLVFLMLPTMALAQPVIGTVSITPTGNQCSATVRTVEAEITPDGPLTSVILEYSFNGVAQTPIVMTGGSSTAVSIWSAVIPVATPANASVIWSVIADDGTNTATQVGTPYSDEPFNGAIANATATPATLCTGSSSVLNGLVEKAVSTTIGAGSSNSNSAPMPFNGGYGGLKGQYLFAAAELNAAGLGAGYINSVSFDVTVAGATLNGFAIEMGHTSLSTFATPVEIQGGLDLVYAPASFAPTVGINTFNFNSPFFWDGSSNVIVSISWSNNNSSNTSSTVKRDATSNYASQSLRRDNVTAVFMQSFTGVSSSGSSTRDQFRPKMAFNGNAYFNINSYFWNDGSSNIGSTNPLSITPSITGSYSFEATDANGCTITSAPETVTVIAFPSAPTANNSSQCGIGVPSASVNSTTGAVNPEFAWYLTASGGTALSGETGAQLSNFSISGTTTFYVTEVDVMCESPRVAVTATVIPPPSVTINPSSLVICAGDNAVLEATSANTDYSYEWMPGNLSSAQVTLNPSTTTTYAVTATDNTSGTYGGCATVETVTVTVNPVPSNVVASVNLSTVCEGALIALSASGTTSPSLLVNEGFEGVPAISFETLGTGVTAGFNTDYYSEGTSSVRLTHTSSANGSYAMDVDYDLTLYTNPTLSFSHICATEANWDYGYVQYSIDGGANWVSFPTSAYQGSGTLKNGVVSFDRSSYSDWNSLFTSSSVTPGTGPATSLWKTETIDLAAFQNQSQFRIRFRITSDGSANYYGWLIDDLRFNHEIMNFTWSSSPAGFVSSSKNTSDNPVVNTDYVVTVTNPGNNCSNTSAPVSVSVLPVPTAPTASNSNQCGVGVPTASVASTTGATAPEFLWYLDVTGGTAIAGESAGQLANYPISGTTTFYVAESDGTCEGPRVAITANVVSPPAIAVSPVSAVICAGDNETLEVSSTHTDYDYVWMPGNLTSAQISVNPTVTTTYTVTATDNSTGAYSGCAASETVVVTVNPAPGMPFALASPTTVCSGETTTLNAVVANQGSVDVGQGATTSSTYPNPFYSLWSNTHNQYLITAAELSASGLFAGNINSLGVYITSGTMVMESFSIKMAHTTATNMSAFVTPSFTTVYSTASYTPVAGTGGALNNFVFGAPFNWDGVSNIVIEICHGRAGSSATMSSTALVDNTTYVSTIHTHKSAATDGAVTCTDFTTNLTTYSIRPKFLFGGISNISLDTYQWSDGTNILGVTAILAINPTTTETYTFMATDTNNCSVSDQVIVNVTPLPNAPTAIHSVQCGEGIPTASVTSTTGASSPVFAWYETQTGGNAITGESSNQLTGFSVSSSTTFYVSEDDGTCESNRVAVNVTVDTPPAITITPASAVICEGDNIMLEVSSTNSGYSYEWMPGNLTTAQVSLNPTATTVYTVSAIDNTTGAFSGCNTEETITVTVNPAPAGAVVTVSNSTICEGETVELIGDIPVVQIGAGSLITTGSGTSATNYVSPFNHYYGGYKGQYLIPASELTAAGLIAGPIGSLSLDVASVGTTYTGFAINLAETSSSALTTTFISSGLQQVYNANETPVVGLNTYNFNNPFLWDGISNIVVQICWSNNNTGGTASEVKYDATSYVSTSYYRADNATVAAICGASTATGTRSFRPKMFFKNDISSYTMEWHDGIDSIGNTNSLMVNPIVTTSYTLELTNGTTGCSTVFTPVTVTVNPLPTITISGLAEVCDGASAPLTASGADTYEWSPSDGLDVTSGANVVSTPLNSVSYTINGTDANGCENTTMHEITVNLNPTVSIASTDISCYGANDGEATAIGNGGSAPYIYTWDTNPVQVGPGTYTVVLTDSKGCTDTESVTINEPDPLAFTSSSTEESCSVFNDGTATVVVTGGTGTMDYDWDFPGSPNAATVTGLASDNYIVTVTDANGCLITASVFVPQQAAPVVTITADHTICEGTQTPLTASGGDVYNWADNTGSIGSNPQIIVSPTVTSVYRVVVLDSQTNCSSTDSVTVSVDPLPVADFTSAIIDFGEVEFTNTSSFGNSYEWDFGDGSPVDNNQNTTYTYTAKGLFDVVMTVTNTCGSDVATQTIEIIGLGIAKHQKANFLIYPNPTMGLINISADGLSTGTVIEVLDNQGRVVYNEASVNFINGSVKQIDLNSMAKGVYYLRIVTGNDATVNKIVVN